MKAKRMIVNLVIDSQTEATAEIDTEWLDLDKWRQTSLRLDPTRWSKIDPRSFVRVDLMAIREKDE